MSDDPPTRIEPPSEDELRKTAGEFRRLLQARTLEPEWQRFFTARPFAMSRSLPLRLEPWHIVPRGRPGKDEPDFVFFDKQQLVSTFGVVELKRPDHKIVTLPRKRIVTLSADATIAVKQVQTYGRRLEDELLDPTRWKSAVALGDSAHLFIIMGLSERTHGVLAQDIDKGQLRGLVPPGIRFITYDDLLSRFELGLPGPVLVLTASPGTPGPPIVSYPTPITVRVGQRVSMFPTNTGGNWTGRVELVGTRVLPRGLTLDPVTGEISGVVLPRSDKLD